MYRSLFSIAEELGISIRKWHESSAPESDYRYCLWLGNETEGFHANCIYVGYASQLPDVLPTSDNGFIIKNDTGREFIDTGASVIELEDSEDPAEICLLIRDKLFDSIDVSLASYKLIAKLLRTSRIKELVDILAEMLDNPVFLNFHYLGQTFYFGGTSDEDDQIEALRELKRSFHDETVVSSINRIWNASRPELTDDGFIYPGHRRIQAAISEGISSQSKIGIITVFEVRQEFTKDDVALIGLISHVISERAGDKDFMIQVTGYQYEQFFHDIIRGSVPKEKPVWMNSVFGSRYRNFRLAVLDVHTLNGVVQDNIRFTLMKMCGYGICFMRGTYLVAVSNIEPGKESEYYDSLGFLAQKHQISIGISEDFTDILKIKKYYSQARKARETGSGKEMKTGIFSFSEYRDALLAKTLLSDGTADIYVHEAYERLRANDVKDGTEYCLTLEAFIACGFDHASTAKRLNIHRNTLGYRLNRIEEITGHSLKDGSFLTSLLLSGAITKAKS